MLYKKGMPLRQPVDTILFWVPGGMSLMLHLEVAIAAALRLRGIKVHAVICDGIFKACVKREIKDGIPVNRWHEVCGQCKAENSAVLESLDIPYSFIGDFISESSRDLLWEMTASITWELLDKLCCHDINIGKNVRSAILRYLKGASLSGHEEIVREYAFSGLVVAEAATSAISRISPTSIFLSHGTYVDWGPALHVALSCGIPVTAWMASYLTFRFYFRHIEDRIRIDFHCLSQTAWEECKRLVLSATQEARLSKFFDDRYKRHIGFDMKHLKQYSGETCRLRQKYVPAVGKPVWGIMAHINWDCVSDYSPMAYDTFDSWIFNTIKEAIQISDVQWLVKVHPAEAWDNPKSGVQRFIQRHFPYLPPHVKVISAEDNINPLDFTQLVDGGVTVYGTVGLELALLGKPVILAGEAHYGGKGFTYDGLSRDYYKELLRKVKTLKPLSEEQRLLARKYAYCYFIQRQIPLPVVKDPNSSWWKFQYNRSQLLLPGKDPFVDFICDRILDGKDFIMSEKRVKISEVCA